MYHAVQKVRYLAILASEEGLKNVLAEFPDLHVSDNPGCSVRGEISYRLSFMDVQQIWVAGIDEKLTENGLIFPGLGDAVRPPPFCK